MTNFSVNVVQIIERALLEYSQGKDGYDARLTQAVQFDYKVIASFEGSGNKVPKLLAQNAIFVECSHIQKDIKEMMQNLMAVFRGFSPTVYFLMQTSFENFLIQINDQKFICDYVPEIDFVLANQNDIYMETIEEQ